MMTKLKCGVANCAYNSDKLCALNDIKVDGQNADTPEHTCCSSFAQASESASNCAGGCACEETGVGCSATNCVHNCDCECHADSIDICGNGADKAEHTACGTFSSK